MDSFKLLEALTEDIVDKQHYLSESLNKLCQKTDTVSSDISNLINSLQMVGNKQFAENRVHDDEMMSEHSQQPKDISMIDGPQFPVSRPELNLSSILLKAIELVPVPDSHDNPPSHTLESEDAQSEETRFVDSTESPHHSEREEDKLQDEDKLQKEDRLQEEDKLQEEDRLQEELSSPKENLIAPKINRLLDRNRVVDILKRYSLYDDDEDEDESE